MRNRNTRKFVSSAFFILLFASLSFGQNLKAALAGQITHRNGAVVANATITITEQTTNQSQIITSKQEETYPRTANENRKMQLALEFIF